MATIKWGSAESIQTYYTTELNSLGNGSFVAAGSAVANATDLFQYIDFEIVLASLSPTAGAALNIWILYTLDGTNYSDGSKPLQTSSLLTSIQLDTTASTPQRIVWANIPIGQRDFKLQVENKAGVALASSGNTLKYSRHYEQVV